MSYEPAPPQTPTYPPRVAEETRIGPGVPPAAPAITPPAKRSKMPWTIAGAALLVFAVAGVILAIQTQNPSTSASASSSPSASIARANLLFAATQACNGFDKYLRLEDGDKTLLIDGRGRKDDGVDYNTVTCMLNYLGAPAAVIAKMEGTNALQGRQEATWDGFTASWTYHPDRGLDLIVQATG